MKNRILKNINELVDVYTEFKSSDKRREKFKQIIPDITESEIKELWYYLEDFDEYCVAFGDKLAEKYRTPFVPDNNEAKNDVQKYVSLCQEKYPEIDERHILGIFNKVCWLANQ